MATRNVIKGALKSTGIPDSACFKNFADLLRNLPNYLTVEIPAEDISNVIISNQQPTDTDRNKLWVRRSNSGKFLGIFLYSGGSWIQAFPAPQQVFILLGNSATPPPGYAFMTIELSGLLEAQYLALYENMIVNSNNGIYPAIFIGI